jgi:D-alanyl-D-alanine carboxypeptidase
MTDSSAALARRLASLLERRVGGRGVAGLAMRIDGGDRVETAWLPRHLADEPKFLLYSITKVFTAAIVLLLQEEDRLDLDAPLARWLPDIADAERISLRQLLAHTAGLPDYGPLATYHEAVRTSPGKPWSAERFAAETYERSRLFEPGAGWAYSNAGYLIVKQVVERVSGEPYARLVSERIARPLGLRSTFVVETREALSSLAPGPSSLLSPDGRLVDARVAYHPGWVSHGVVASTATETARFLAALSDDRLLAPASWREMTTLVRVPEAPAHWRRPSYGLGLMADPASRWGALFGHGGEGPGYTTAAFHAPDLPGGAVTVAALCAVEGATIAETLVFDALDLGRDASRGSI